jgi:hypothetical protein
LKARAQALRSAGGLDQVAQSLPELARLSVLLDAFQLSRVEASSRFGDLGVG